jgi:hypothetical protein
LVERFVRIEEVRGSNPLSSTKVLSAKGRYSQPFFLKIAYMAAAVAAIKTIASG